MYNNIAKHYALADRFGSLRESHAVALAQIQKASLGRKPHYKVLDLGVGDGAFLQSLRPMMPEADFTGLDISSQMLERARQSVSLKTIESSAIEASQYLPAHSQDLVLAHFVNAYIPIQDLFKEVNSLMRANGYFSLITTTYESFPVGQKHLAEFIAQGNLLSSVIGHYYKSMLKNTTVAAHQEELLSVFKQHHFTIVDHYRLSLPICLDNVDELALFGIEGTWFLNSLSVRMLPKSFLLDRLKRLFEKFFTFPYQDTHIIDIILAKK